MSKKEILDDNLLEGDNSSETITQKPLKRTIIYLIIMTCLSYAYVYFTYLNTLLPKNIVFYTTMVVGIICGCIITSFILELIRFLFRKIKNRNKKETKRTDPFWFQIIEGAFAIWILFMVVKAVIQGIVLFYL